MKRLFLVVSFLVLIKIAAQTWNTEEQYIQRFAPYAVEEMEKYKIPASITLAQGLLETGGGQSRLAKEGNNHFGIKCKKEDWYGKTMKHTDDAPNECFRVYDNPRESYEDHSEFLASRKYYANLFKLNTKDYKAWAHGLKKAGYATNPRYAYILIDKIQKYKLYEFDNTNSKEVLYAVLKLYPELQNDRSFMANLNGSANTSSYTTLPNKKTIQPANVPNKREYKKPIPETKPSYNRTVANIVAVKIHPNGNRKYVIIPSNTSVVALSNKFKIPANRLKRYNELENDYLRANDIVFLEPKASSATVANYRVKSGDTMHKIAQKFGIKLKKLYAKNRMNKGSEPKVGQLIYLQKRKPR